MDKENIINLFGLKISLSGRVGLQIKLTLIFVLLLCLLAIINFFVSYLQTLSAINEELGQGLLGIAKTISENLKDSNINFLQKEELKDKLKSIQINNRLSSIYILLKKEGQIYLINDSRRGSNLFSLYHSNKEIESAFSGYADYTKQFLISMHGLEKSAYAPIYNKKRVIAVVGVDGDEEKFIQQIYLIRAYSVLSLLFSIILSILISLIVATSITSPIKQLLAGMHRVTKGDLNYQIKIRNLLALPWRDEIGELAISFNRMTNSLQEKSEENKLLYEEIRQFNLELERKIKDATKELEEINKKLREKEEQRDEELTLASQIQKTLLPHYYKTKGVNIETMFVPAEELGGDFYNFFPIDNNNLGIIIGDVTGKGVPAALLMAMTLGILHESSKGVLSPAKVLLKSNSTIKSHLDVHFPSFSSAFYGVLNLEKKVFTYSKAGHEEPILFREKETCYLKAGGSFLGAFEQEDYEEREIQLKKGDKIILYTDGITGAKNKQEERFGEERLKNLIEENGYLKGELLLKKIHEEIISFSEKTSLSDDLALVVMEIE